MYREITGIVESCWVCILLLNYSYNFLLSVFFLNQNKQIKTNKSNDFSIFFFAFQANSRRKQRKQHVLNSALMTYKTVCINIVFLMVTGQWTVITLLSLSISKWNRKRILKWSWRKQFIEFIVCFRTHAFTCFCATFYALNKICINLLKVNRYDSSP